MTGAQSCSGITSWKMHRSAKALCKRIDPFAKRAFQHAVAYGLRLSARRRLRRATCQHFSFLFRGRAPSFLPGSIISRIGVEGVFSEVRGKRQGRDPYSLTGAPVLLYA